jgi:hypothetical protein
VAAAPVKSIYQWLKKFTKDGVQTKTRQRDAVEGEMQK